jgi:pimeloyl-ACP methyl ester carboxylesterase
VSRPPRPAPAYKARGGAARRLLFLHGIGGGRHSFDAQFDAFADRWRCLAWDMPGYGESQPLPAMTFPALAEAARDLLDWEGCDKAVVLGHSFGGMVAQELALAHPDRVAALVLFATAGAFGGKDASFKNAFLADRLAPLDRGQTPADIAPELLKGMLSDAAPPPARRAAIASMSAISSKAYRAALNCVVTFDRLDDLPRIACPTLALAAEHDRLSPPRTMESLARRIPGAVFATLPGAGHLATLEAPAAFNAALGEFLATLN